MKNLLYSLIMCFCFSICTVSLFSQGKPAKLPMENKAVFENYLRDVYTAYEKMDYKALKNNYYGRMAGEIGPDGVMVQGIKALEASWKAMDAMFDERPTFKYQLTSSRMVTPEVAIITWTSDDDIMIKGEQVGGKITGMAVLKKKGNSWNIEFDTITKYNPPPPPPPMPEKKEEPAPENPGGN